MGWTSAVKKTAPAKTAALKPKATAVFSFPLIPFKIDLSKVVTVDYETYYDADYTLRKMNTSEYVRDPRYKAHMVGIKIGKRATKVYPTKDIDKALKAIDWSTHYLLCHHTQFDGFIMSHHHNILPHFCLDTLSMARALHSNEIGVSLNEVAQFYGKGNKLPDILEQMKGVRDLPPALYKKGAAYCARDVDLTFEIFVEMLPKMPAPEIRLIDHTVQMFTNPVLKVDVPIVAKEHAREVAHKEAMLLSMLGTEKQVAKLMKEAVFTNAERKELGDAATTRDLLIYRARKLIGGGQFADLLRAEGVEPPMKISPAWFKHKDDSKKYAYAFAKTDLAFTALQEHPNKKVRDLVECRLSVKSSIGETRAVRFMEAGKNGLPLPVYLKYYGAHTGRWSAGNKMNMQNLPRENPDDPDNSGILRKSILAPKGHVIAVADSGQIEARVNGWLWGQDDLMDGFRLADAGKDRDVYCKFADTVYGREITKKDKLERFVGKIAVLGLGYQMGPAKFQNTLALGTMGPAVFIDQSMAQQIVNAYRRKNHRIAAGWRFLSETVLPDMARGREGEYKCLTWGKEFIQLPNGMRLKYPKLKCENNGQWDEWSYERKGDRAKIYGGLMCENIVQALARIIVGEQLLTIGEQYRVVTTTHDEIVTIAKTREGKKCYDFMHKVMMTPPQWCADIPLSAEGGFAVNYSK